ncbi:HAD-IA family hydrolase [Rhodococcus globerulus]|uniref:HAD-IA family hydrolase n=1 Tax=Rhodococcus globerulus TaxID=33008 RepID=UPI000A53B30A|nr:HAD-IA family hydrolase [Rhodococcus globerulus]
MTIWRADETLRASIVIDGEVFRAVLFDMDGVVTDTAKVHLAAWRRLFHYLTERGGVGDVELSDDDYRRYIDGKARAQGLQSYLTSRNVVLPLGNSEGSPNAVTIAGLLGRKNTYFLEELGRHRVEVIVPTVRWIQQLRSAGVHTAIVSASRNAKFVLDSAHLANLFDIRCDGIDAAKRGLAGKPNPDTYMEAAARLSVPPSECVVIEDATAGIRAANSGGFGLSIGLGPAENVADLIGSGADFVVSDVSEIVYHFVTSASAEGDNNDAACELCTDGADPSWSLEYRGRSPDTAGLRETLLTQGNGYFATRGALPESHDDGVHYPGTYIAGCYNRLTSEAAGRSRDDESAVNIPDWTVFTVAGPDGQWLGSGSHLIDHHHEEFDLRCGTVRRETTFRDITGRVTRIRQQRFVSMDDPHLAAICTAIIPENWDGTVHVRSGINAAVSNNNVPDYSLLANHHLTVISAEAVDHERVSTTVETSTSHIRVSQCERLRVRFDDGSTPQHTRRVDVSENSVAQLVTYTATSGQPVVFEKTMSLFTSRDHAIAEPDHAAREHAIDAADHRELFRRHCIAWELLWHKFAITLGSDVTTSLAANVQLVHALQTLSAHTIDLDVGVPARGLHGEAYRGHVFWDELFVTPILTLRLPELTRSLLLYRSRRLRQAKSNAGKTGHYGALFPWQSGSDGREETPTALFNPRSKRWMPDNSRRQHHVNLAVAYNVWHYWQTTTDLEFLRNHAVELLVENARFWISRADYDATDDRYDVRGIMGPDEFHDGYPGRPGEGIDNNTYVNIMTEWSLMRALDAVEILGRTSRSITEDLEVTESELAAWDKMSRRLRLTFLPNGLLAQFEGFDTLKELDWADYRSRYLDIGRLDLILEAEGDSTVHYKASKQADLLMLLYVFSAEELTDLIARLGYTFDPSSIPSMIDYYLSRTTHGSTLSRIAHTWVLVRGNRSQSWDMLRSALASDLSDSQHGRTREGIHLAAMAGAIDILERCYTGLDFREDILWLHPQLPIELSELVFTIYYRGHRLQIQCTHSSVTVSSETKDAAPIELSIHGSSHIVLPGSSVTVSAQ